MGSNNGLGSFLKIIEKKLLAIYFFIQISCSSLPHARLSHSHSTLPLTLHSFPHTPLSPSYSTLLLSPLPPLSPSHPIISLRLHSHSNLSLTAHSLPSPPYTPLSFSNSTLSLSLHAPPLTLLSPSPPYTPLSHSHPNSYSTLPSPLSPSPFHPTHTDLPPPFTSHSLLTPYSLTHTSILSLTLRPNSYPHIQLLSTLPLTPHSPLYTPTLSPSP